MGQPVAVWQNGTPQSMHRAPWRLNRDSSGSVKISLKSPIRSAASR